MTSASLPDLEVVSCPYPCSALIATRARLHPWSLLSHHGSPGILDLMVSLFNLIIFFLGFKNGPDRVSASKVGVLDFFHSTDVYRSRFDSAALTAGSNDPTETFGVVSGWLHDVGTSMVSGFALSRLIDADILNLESSVAAPMLPRHPGLECGFINPYYSFSRSPYRLDRVNAS